MNKAITDGLVLMPPAFAAGLNLWSREDGLPGQGSYLAQPNAAFVPTDQDFGGCLELQKTLAVQKLRCFANIPYQSGMYLRVTARIKAVSGNLPSVRIAAWAGASGGTAVSGIPLTGTEVALTSYGTVVTVQAIIGSGNRTGVNMVWGTTPAFSHVGIDLTGSTGGVVRIDDIVVEDVTEVFHRNMMDWVDVRDYGAKGDGVTDDAPAFAAADAAAQGRRVLVSKGTYFLNNNVSMTSDTRFEGTLIMPSQFRLALSRNYTLDAYTAAFGNELTGFRKALQALFFFSDHVALDLSGRRVDLDGPIDVAALCGLTNFTVRRVIRNGQLNAISSTNWATTQVTSTATYNTSQPTTLSAVANVANVPVGSLVTGSGVGREVYVTSKNVGAGTVTLSEPLHGGSGTRTYTFQRFRYMLDFSGFVQLSRFEVVDMEIQCNGLCSGISLAVAGITFRLADVTINRPLNRGLTSSGSGCQGMFVDQCQFLSNEQSVPVENRISIAMNVNANDVKIRNNRVVRFAHFAIVNGTGHMVHGNHFFQGDDAAAGVRRAGLVFTQTNVSTVVSGNYVDNCFIEWGNEHDALPDFNNEFSFGGLNIVGNIFICSAVASSFRWIVMKPYGIGHFINGFSMTNNSFRSFDGSVDRVETVDTTFAQLDFSKSRNVRVEGNSFNQVSQIIMNPLVASHQQNTAADTWVVNLPGFIPFNGRVRMVESVVPEGTIQTSTNVPRYISPNALPGQGLDGNQSIIRWGEAVKGKVVVVSRMDLPS